MKIRFEKMLTVINTEKKVSAKTGQEYGMLKCFDQDGNYHDIYVKGELLPDVEVLTFKEDVSFEISVTYKGKYPKIELVKVNEKKKKTVLF